MYSEENKKEKKKENLTNWNIYSGKKRKKENIIYFFYFLRLPFFAVALKVTDYLGELQFSFVPLTVVFQLLFIVYCLFKSILLKFSFINIYFSKCAVSRTVARVPKGILYRCKSS